MITQEYIQKLFYYQDGDLVRVGKSEPNQRKPGSEGYLPIAIDGKDYKLHRIIYLYHHGDMPAQIDHVDGDKLNNRIENLRACTLSQNQHNAQRRKDNTSGIKGITWCRSRGQWLARVKYKGRQYFVGYFNSIENAERELKAARESLHGKFTNHG